MHSTTILLSALSLMAFTTALPNTLGKRDTCGIHVNQFQKNEASSGNNPDYQYSLVITSGNTKQTIPQFSLANGASATEQVPGKDQVVLTSGSVDADPVDLSYDGFSWTSADENCSQGSYSGGERQIDCTFGC